MNFIQKLLAPPEFEDDEKNRIASFLHTIILTVISVAILVSLIDALGGTFATGLAMLSVVVPLIAVYWLNRRGNVTAASYITMVILTVGVTIILSVGQGIHDIGIIDYALILILGSFLLKGRGIIFITACLIISVGVIVFGEMKGLLPVQNAPESFTPRVADFFIVALTLIIGAVAINLLSKNLQEAFDRTKLTEKRWRLLVDGAPDIILFLDRNGIITFANQSAADLPGLKMGSSLLESIPDSQVNDIQTAINFTIRGHEFRNEIPLKAGGGNFRWHSVRMSPIFELIAFKELTGIMLIATDIQEKIDGEKELKNSREAIRLQAEQLATLYEISKTLSALKDLKNTLQAILTQIKAALPLDAFVVTLYDAEKNIITFPLMYDDGKLWDEAPRELKAGTYIARAIQTRQAFIENRSPNPEEENQTPKVGLLGSQRRSLSVLIAPMLVHDQVIGTVALHCYQTNVYTQQNLALIVGAANQIGIAIENARLYETSQIRAEQMAALNDIARSISSLRDLKDVLESAFELLHYILQLDAFYIVLYDDATKTVAYPYMVDDGKKWNEEPVPDTLPASLVPNTLLEKTISTRSPYLINRTKEEIENRLVNLQQEHFLGNKARVAASILMAPLQYSGKITGAISAQSYTPNAYTEDDLKLLSGAANQIAIAIENARLYSELQKELNERKRAEEAVRLLNAELEIRVRQRTAELEETNKELSSFTYTVSHDLRAPIRGVHGLSHIFLEEYGQNIPKEGITYIERIQANARQMGQLIDELLAFTHLGRQPVFKIGLDMDALVQAVIVDLTTATAEERQIKFTVDPLPKAYGDEVLIRQVLRNLIANAIKFTQGRENVQIEIGSLHEEKQVIYYIRDNGAGFDMAYSNKLFGVFQRLHRQDEFEGTGVGLAMVKRIIDRHGGRIWAEGKPDEGATFYFTLPAKKEKHK